MPLNLLIKISSLFILLFLHGLDVEKPGPWELRKNKDGVKVFSRIIPGTDIKELRGEITVHATLNTLIAFLKDVPEITEWVYKSKEAYELKRPDEHQVYYYQRTDVPWPLDDRDLIIYSRWQQDKNTKLITLTSKGEPDYMPEKQGVVRIRHFTGSWRLIPQGGGNVLVQYEVSVDPAGLIPVWLINLAAVDGPYETCLGLAKCIKKPKYANAKVSGVLEN